ncbi:F-box domain containing protein [Trema orientale]|uniref:F-box domain containing protein n=1 Tax=Trema orientale TaxID=63057 RepID=A0A2P5FFC2_TREOI|nr:F-box domain containing protein [Trema orientale]
MAMKRKRILSPSPACGTEKSSPDELIQISGSAIIDLPNRILFKILFNLPTKSIVFCKSVCKKWRILISSPQFAELHLAQAKPQLLLRALDSIRVSRTLFLVEPDCADGRGFDLDQYCSCPREQNSGRYCHMELNAKLKIPLRNAEPVLENQDDPGPNRRRCLNLKPKDHKYKIVNSCNGLLCLSGPSRNDPVAVCNPVTGEFINLPQSTADDEDVKSWVDCGLGFSPKSNQYKVIRVFDRNTWFERPVDHYDDSFNFTNKFAEVHTLGTDSWRSVVHAPNSNYKLGFPTYLKGALYWLYLNNRRPNYIVSFKFDNEQFVPVSLPCECERTSTNVSMGVLRGDLCVCDASDFTIKIWALKNYSTDFSIRIWTLENYNTVRKSWTKLLTVDTEVYGLYQPINYFKNGALLMFRNYTKGLVYYPDGLPDKYLGLRGLKSRYEAIVHIPSFISLKDIVVGNDVEILNVNSRCGNLKLAGETKSLNLEAQHEEMGYIDCSSYEIEDDYWNKYLWRKY